MTLFYILLGASYVVSYVNGICSDCAYRGCHKTDDTKLNVHLIAHTHNDAGWLKTVDQYFYGGALFVTDLIGNSNHAGGGVQYIIDSVMGELDADQNRRFVLAETLFLWMWWTERSDHVREKLKKYVETGRVQIVGGGWVQSDEATPHYTMLIDQMSLGIRFLYEIFGECGIPKIAWQIDSFGHSSEQASQFIEMGYDAAFFGRINQDEYLTRRDRHEMEMLWTPYNGGRSLFTTVLYNLYQPPDGFCFDVSCRDEPIIDNPRSHGYNMARRISSFVSHARMWSNAYKTNHVLLTMGGDFHYMVASSWFVNLDKIIRNVNEQYPDMNVIYSTPACYLKAINHLNITWPVKDDEDFFPYSSYEKKYWTGYYTSRPNLKYYIAQVNNLLQVVKKMGVFTSTWNRLEEFEIERAVALAQHHDAISGTQRQHVAADYALYLHEAVVRSQDIIAKAYRSWGEPTDMKHQFCLLRNISSCSVSERSRAFILYVFNPLATYTNVTVRLPFAYNYIEPFESEASPVNTDIMPVPAHVTSIPGRHSLASNEIVFQASRVPPMGYKTYFIQQQRSLSAFADHTSDSRTYPEESSSVPSPDITVGFEDSVQIVMNSTSGLLQYVVIDDSTWHLEQNFGYYGNHQRWFSSGAYTFSPSSKGLIMLPITPSFTIHQGQNVIEIHQNFTSWINQVIRIYRGQQSIEFEWCIGPIDIKDGVSKDFVTVYQTHLSSRGVFYTDSNGRKFMKRKRDFLGKIRHPDGGIEANYYPVTTAAKINDDRATLTVLTDRAQGASSSFDGSLEFMIHRRLLNDDGKGVTEPLDEKAFGHGIVARGKHIVQFTRNLKTAYHHRMQSLAITQGPWISMVPTNITIKQWKPKEVSFLRNPLPENIHILTLQKLTQNTILLRLEHIFDTDEDRNFSVPVEIDLTQILSKNIRSFQEVALNGVSSKECSVKRLNWGFGANNRTTVRRPFSSSGRRQIIVMEPMEIRTFILQI